MGALPFFLVFCGAVLAAIQAILIKHLQNGKWKGKVNAVAILNYGGGSLLLLAFSFLNGGPQIAEGGGAWYKSFWFSILALASLNIVISWSYTKASDMEDVSLVSPITAFTPAILVVSSAFFFREYPSWLGGVGIFLIILGAYVLNIKKVFTKDLLEPLKALTRSSGVRWALVAAILAGVSMNYDGIIARKANVAFGFGLAFCVSSIFYLYPAYKRGEFAVSVQGMKLTQWLVIAGAPIMFAASIYITNSAFCMAIVPYVGTLKRLRIPLIALFAWFFLKERGNFRQRFLSAILMAAGAVLIGLSKEPDS